MMVFMYFCVLMSAMAPGGQTLARYYVDAVEDSFRAMVDGRNAMADTIADLRAAR